MSIYGIWRDSREVGSCNYCTVHVTSTGATAHPVFEVHSDNPTGGIVVRFCRECLKTLLKQVKP